MSADKQQYLGDKVGHEQRNISLSAEPTTNNDNLPSKESRIPGSGLTPQQERKIVRDPSISIAQVTQHAA